MGPGHAIYSRKSSLLDAGGFEECGVVLAWPLSGGSCGRYASRRESDRIRQLSLQSKFLPSFRERCSPPNPESASIGRNLGWRNSMEFLLGPITWWINVLYESRMKWTLHHSKLAVEKVSFFGGLRVVLLQLLSIHNRAVGVTNLGVMLLWEGQWISADTNLTLCGLVIASWLCNIGSGNGLLSDNTKPLPEPGVHSG